MAEHMPNPPVEVARFWWAEEVARQQARYNYNPNDKSKYDHDPRTDQEKALDTQLPPIEPPPGYGNRFASAMQGCQEDEIVEQFLGMKHERQFETTTDELPPQVLPSMGPNMQEYNGPEAHMPEPDWLNEIVNAQGVFREIDDALPPNPKQAYGDKKVPLHLVPPVAMVYMAMAFKEGAQKYGAYNWRDKAVEAQTYIGAALRHIFAWQDGEELDLMTGHPHLAHALACLAILADATECGNLIDNRPPPGPAGRALATWEEWP